MKNTSIKIILASLALFNLYNHSYAQKFRFLGHVYYGTAGYSYDESQYLYQRIKTSQLPVYGIQTSAQIMVSKNFRIGTGLNYLRMKGKTDPVFVDKGLINTNTTGYFTLDVNSAYLQFPFEFIVTLTQRWKIKPFLIGGAKFYKPLKENYFAKIDPINPTPYYSKVEATVDHGKEYRGLFIGSGVIVPLPKNNEMELRLSYLANNFFYETKVAGTGKVTEESSFRFRILEVSAGIKLFQIN